jgi:hypothetical protein
MTCTDVIIGTRNARLAFQRAEEVGHDRAHLSVGAGDQVLVLKGDLEPVGPGEGRQRGGAAREALDGAAFHVDDLAAEQHRPVAVDGRSEHLGERGEWIAVRLSRLPQRTAGGLGQTECAGDRGPAQVKVPEPRFPHLTGHFRGSAGHRSWMRFSARPAGSGPDLATVAQIVTYV